VDRGTIETATKDGLKAQLGALTSDCSWPMINKADVTDKLETAKAAMSHWETKATNVPPDR